MNHNLRGLLISSSVSVSNLHTCNFALLRFSRFKKYFEDFSLCSYQSDFDHKIIPAVM